MTKTIGTALLMGILVDKYGVTLDMTLGEIFQDSEKYGNAFDLCDENWQNVTVDYMKSITLYEIMTMTSGLTFDPYWTVVFGGPPGK